MSERTITMTADGLDSLRTGIITVRVNDSSGRSVVLFPQEVWDSSASRPDDLAVVLSHADLDEIEQEPDGLLVLKLPFGAEDSSYLIRMEAA
ncbi:hypothetical protein ACWKSP_22305 [Micromonosporaceae bacterium Da 78-11]